MLEIHFHLGTIKVHYNLINDVFNPKKRPVRNSSASIPITFELFIAQLIQINEVSQVSLFSKNTELRILPLIR